MELFKFNELSTLIMLRASSNKGEPSIISFDFECSHLEQLKNFANQNSGILITSQVNTPTIKYTTSFQYTLGHIILCCRYYFSSQEEWEKWHAKYGDCKYLKGGDELTIG